MKRLCLFIALALSLAAPAAFGEEAAADWFWGKPIAGVQWEGVKNADKRELDSAMRPYVGKAFSEELWVELQARVYELDWFDPATIQSAAFPADEEKTKVLIKFTVTEKPAVDAVRVVGNSGLRSSDILDVVKIKAGDIFNPSKTKLDELAVRRLYLEKGYPDAQVSSSTSTGPSGGVVLSFAVVEGSQVAIKEIRFTGNVAFSSQTLKGQLSLKEAGLFQAGAFQELKLEEDKQKVVAYYRARGYVDAAVADVVRSVQKDEKSGKNWLVLTFALKEGRQWTYAGMAFEGNEIFGSDKLAALVFQKEGGILNYGKLMQDKQRIDDLYYENGYIFNSLDLAERRDEEKLSIAYTVRIVERDRAHIESITFKGNKKTKEAVMARELPLEVGDIFSKAKIVEGLRNLYNLQYFSAIEPEMLPGGGENLMDLVINVEEQSTADIQFGVTLSGLGEPDTFPVSGLIKWNDKNFLGNGQTFGIETNISPDTQDLTFSFLDNWLFGKRISGGIDLSLKHEQLWVGQDILGPIFYDEDVPDPYDSLAEFEAAGSSISSAYKMPYENWEVTLGLSGGYKIPTQIGDVGFGLGLSSTLSNVSYDSSKYRPYLKELRDAEGLWLLTNKVLVRGYLNDLDLWYNPGKGYYASQRLTWAGVFAGEAQKYIRSDSRLDAFATLFNIPVFEGWNFKWVLGAHTGFSAILPQPGASAVVNQTDALRIDGTFVGRGWSSLYDVEEGRTLWENWVELRMPIFEQFIWLDGFVDAAALRTETGLVVPTDGAANAAQRDFSSLAWKNFAFSTGFGFRFTIPQFPFRFYFAKRFAFDGKSIDWAPDGASGMDFVISISQPLK